jgi:hypothetical protein
MVIHWWLGPQRLDSKRHGQLPIKDRLSRESHKGCETKKGGKRDIICNVVELKQNESKRMFHLPLFDFSTGLNSIRKPNLLVRILDAKGAKVVIRASNINTRRTLQNRQQRKDTEEFHCIIINKREIMMIINRSCRDKKKQDYVPGSYPWYEVNASHQGSVFKRTAQAAGRARNRFQNLLQN